jgi:putative transposon-encoded protein
MIVNPELIPTSSNAPGIVMQKILAVQQEILMINKHGQENIMEVRRLQNAGTSYQTTDAISDGQQKHDNEFKKRIETLNEVERIVDIAGKNASVLVPKTWAGKRVRITLMND